MVTVLVATYNPIWEKLRATLISILRQKKITYEIVIADDGSSIKHKEKIMSLFEQYEFKEFSIVESEVNRGTCWNFYNGLLNSKYEYIKAISPGDLLYEDNTLREWFDYMKQEEADVCFGNAVYYEADTYRILEGFKTPKYITPYNCYTPINLKKEYLLIPDPILGAGFLVKKSVALYYIKKILGHVKYCEDYYLKLFVMDGGKILFFNRNVIWYEHGLGVSTNLKWKQYIENDKIECAKVLFNATPKLSRWRLVWRYQMLKSDLPKWRVFLFPSLLLKLLEKKYKKEKHISTTVNMANLLLCYREK